MRVVLLGAPGSGKGTQAARLKEHLQVPHISTGDLLRAEVAAGTDLGKRAKDVMDAGNLVSDDILLGMLESRLGQADVANGFILDGYPRNVAQANAMDGLLAKIGQPLDAVVQLDVATELLVDDLSSLVKAWAPDQKANYRATFEKGGVESLRKMFVAMGSLSRGELAGERLEEQFVQCGIRRHRAQAAIERLEPGQGEGGIVLQHGLELGVGRLGRVVCRARIGIRGGIRAV